MPFILVSGEIGEDTAVEAMRNGASDYLLKNNLARLAPAMEHAIEAAEVRRARVAADEELQASRQRLAELAQHLQTSVEQERSAIAREIHDDVGGSLTALNFDLAWIARHADSERVRARAQSALETVTHAIEASQRIMHNLRPAILEQGLVAALQWMASRHEKRTGIECSFHTSHESLQLPAGVPLVAYRTAQEALTNVSKHAQPRACAWTCAGARGAVAGNQRQRPRPGQPRPGQGTQLRHPRPAGTRRHGRRLDRSVEFGPRHDADPVGAAMPALADTPDAPAAQMRRRRRRARSLGLGKPMIQVILCDDHALIRRGIRDTLSDAADIQVVGEAGDYGELRAVMRKLRRGRRRATCWCWTSTCPGAAAWTCCTC